MIQDISFQQWIKNLCIYSILAVSKENTKNYNTLYDFLYDNYSKKIYVNSKELYPKSHLLTH